MVSGRKHCLNWNPELESDGDPGHFLVLFLLLVGINTLISEKALPRAWYLHVLMMHC